MIERLIFNNTSKIGNPTLRRILESTARLILGNWFYILFALFLWQYPYIVANWTDSEVMPRRPTGESAFWQSEMARALAVSCLAMSYNLLFGYSGIVSFGHAFYFGVGGYTTFMLLYNYDPILRTAALVIVLFIALGIALFKRDNLRSIAIFALGSILLILLLLPGGSDISFYQAAGIAVIISIAISLLSGAVTLRLRGIYFTMFTLALAEMFFVLAKSGTFRDYTGAEDGLGFRDILPESLNSTPTFDGSRLDMYRVTVVFFIIIFLLIRRYLNSPVGRVMLAIRENEERARTIGFNTVYYKVLTMAFSGVIATLSGLFFLLWATDKRVHPEILSIKWTVEPLLHTLIGGVGTLTGPVVAALSLVLGETYLRNETFTLDSTLLGPLAMWHLASMLVVALLLWMGRRPLRTLVREAHERFAPDNANLPMLLHGGFIVLSLALGLIIGNEVVHGSDLQNEEYLVSDLWDLALGIVFVIVVMVLPLGIVGTWNRYWITRRIRRLEGEMHKSARKTG